MKTDVKHYRKRGTVKTFEEPVRRFRDNIDMDKLDLFLRDEPELQDFLAAMHDPAYGNLSFVTLCKKFNVSLGKLQSIYTDGMRHIGLLRMSTALPEVMADVAEDAKSRTVTCSRCDGLKVVRLPVGSEQLDRPCPACSGKGEIRTPGDKHARDLVFESMKLTGQAGPLVAIQQNFTGGDESMEAMFKTTQMITIGHKETKDNETE